MHVVGEVLGRVGDPILLSETIGVVALVDRLHAALHLEVEGEALLVQGGDGGDLLRIGDDDPLPLLAVRSGRCLEGDLEALGDRVELDGLVEVHALADGTSGGEDFVGGEVQLRHPTSIEETN